MKVYNYQDMVKGWFVGAFTPTALNTKDVEVGVKKYKKGAYEEHHHHKIATELTFILEGKVRMNGIEYQGGDIISIAPNESTDFEALEDTTTVVVKVPGALNDKYMGSSVD